MNRHVFHSNMQGLDNLFEVSDDRKRVLLQQLGVLNALSVPSESLQLDVLLISARVHCISKIELYFLQDAQQLKQPLNLRNEAAAVSLLLGYFAEHPGSGSGVAGSSTGSTGGDSARQALLAALLEYSRTLWPELASGDVTVSTGGGGSSSGAGPPGEPVPPGSPAAEFQAWAVEQQGVGTAIGIASFGELRGCAASRGVSPGDLLLSIPSEVLIYEDTVKATDLGRMLHAIPDLTIDNLLIIFTMIDRHDSDSRWAPYWRSLPGKFFTGLSFPQHLVHALAGTAAQLELSRAQAHLRQQYAATRPLFDMLLTAYPQFLHPEWFDYENYLWAAELWYSYAFDVEFPEDGAGGAAAAATSPSGKLPATGSGLKGSTESGKGSKNGKAKHSGNKGKGGSRAGGSSDSASSSCKPVMVPFACHVNHSPWPHCVRYGRLNPSTRTLDFPAFRPCQGGQQVFISYGPVPNLKLLCYYGFVVPCNPHDLVPLQLEPPEGALQERQLAALQVLGLGLEHSLQDGPLSRQLLACLRVIVATATELANVIKGTADPLAGAVTPENEDQALRTLEAALVELLALLEALPLLTEAEAQAAPSSSGGGKEAAAEQQLQQLHLQQGATDGGSASARTTQTVAAANHQQEQQGFNENGFDADWRTSRRFCRLYLEGQQHILQRNLRECRSLLQADEAPVA